MEHCMRTVLDRFPKVRPTLPDEYLALYEREQLENRTRGGLGNSIARFLESWMHKQIAKDAISALDDVLEVGAGPLNHLDYEDSYAAYDVVEPFRKLLESSNTRRSLRQIYTSTEEIPELKQYDRIISVAVLEHMLDLPRELARSGLLLKASGRFCAGVPSEGSPLWEAAWRYGTGPGFKRRTGLDYEPMMNYEHVNTVDEIDYCIRYFFRKVSVRRFPLPVKFLSLYTYYLAEDPDLGKCKNFLTA